MNMLAQPDTTRMIPVTLDQGEANQCPYVSWFRFQKCTIRSCKNFSTKTKSCCLAIDREAPTGNKIISDAEIHLFKYPNDGVSTRHVSMKRKKAVDRVKCMLMLHSFIVHIKGKYGSSSEVEREHFDPAIGVAESAYPLRIPRLQFKNWMWTRLLSETEFALFLKDSQGECAEFGMHDLLSMSEDGLRSLRQVVAFVSAGETN